MKYIEVSFPKNEILPYILGDLGYESFIEEGDRLLAYIQEDNFCEEALHDIAIDEARNYVWKPAEYKDWNEEWESHGFEPIIINKNLIIHDLIHPIDISEYKYNIVIDAHQAFGTGTHETTRMMIKQLLNSIHEINKPNVRILDCGCGTGILSIVAAKLGAAEIFGYDIDEWSIENSIHNARLNNITNCHFVQGNANVLGKQITGKFDIILANINRNILIADIAMFHKMMHENSTLFVSGFYCSNESVIKNEFSKYNLIETNQKLNDNNWQCLAFREKPLVK